MAGERRVDFWRHPGISAHTPLERRCRDNGFWSEGNRLGVLLGNVHRYEFLQSRAKCWVFMFGAPTLLPLEIFRRDALAIGALSTNLAFVAVPLSVGLASFGSSIIGHMR